MRNGQLGEIQNGRAKTKPSCSEGSQARRSGHRMESSAATVMTKIASQAQQMAKGM